MIRTALVVPCYNEARRLRASAFLEDDSERAGLHFVFVDDGSTDGTAEILESLVEGLGRDRAQIVTHCENAGKAEAVRRGLLHAFGLDPEFVGYWDADLATPLDQVQLLGDLLDSDPRALAVIGSRVRLMGRHIERRATRHYTGRVFATLASLTLRFPVYDTQCGAKLFRATPETRLALTEPYISRWAFDVEILARLAQQLGCDPGAAGRIIECPLTRWRDVGDSRLKAGDIPRIALDLLRIARTYRREADAVRTPRRS